MDMLLYIGLTILIFVLMEPITWATHRYVMHGFLWSLHRDHHEPNHSKLEKNDWFAFIFSIPSMLCFYFGHMRENPWYYCLGTGILLYGIAYFFVHDIIIHQRVKWFTRSKNRYIRQLRWAHKMHHKHLGPENGESFGFLYVEKKYRAKIKRDDDLNNNSAQRQ